MKENAEGAVKPVRGHTVLLVDRSYSMKGRREEAEQGVNQFKTKYAGLTSKSTAKVTMSLYQFSATRNVPVGRDLAYEKVWGPVKAKDAPDYVLDADGNTALYDAVGRVIIDTEQEIAQMKKPPTKVVIAIMTDGEENSSVEFTFQAVKDLIDRKKEDGWEFIFLAGSLKAVGFGVASGLTTTGFNPNAKGQMANAYAAASTATMDWYEGTTRGVEMPTSVEEPADADAK